MGHDSPLSSQARFLLDDEVAAVSCVQSPLVDEIAGRRVTADGYCSAQLRMARRADVPVHVSISARCPGLDFENRLRVVGTRGTLDIDFLDASTTVFRPGEAPAVAPGGGNAWSQVGTAALARRLRDGDVDGLATLEDGYRVQLATDAAHRSAADGGTWVRVRADGDGDGDGDGDAAEEALTLATIRDRQAAFARKRDWDQFHTPRNVLLALVGEVGELAEIFQWKGDVARGLPAFTDAEKVHVGEELSDVLVYLVRLADVCGVDLDAAVTRKMDRNAEKYPADRCYGSSAKYTAYEARPSGARSAAAPSDGRAT